MSDLRVTVKRQKTGGYTASPPPPPAPTKPGRRPKSILDYLCSLTSQTLTQLYRDPFTVLTVFRSLPPLSKHFVLRLLTVSASPDPSSPDATARSLSVEKSLVDGWCRAELTAQQAHHQAMTRLFELHIFLRTTKSSTLSSTDAKDVPAYRLNHAFAAQLQRALTNQVPDLVDDASSSTASSSLNTDELTSYAAHRWNQLLHFMVGVRTLGLPSAAVQSHLLSMQLMAVVDGKAVITPLGFSFLFKDQHTQVWDLVLAYVGGVGDGGGEREEVLTFLFHLAFMRVGRDYAKAKLTPAQRRMVDDLSGFGLIMLKGPAFLPTHLVYNLSSSSSTASASAPAPSVTSAGLPSSSSSSSSGGYLIVETTFKVYAYTTSPFQLSLLNLFLRFDYHLPNLLVASITKESIRHALINHITSQEIIAYMEQYAHPCMRTTGASVLPENVVDAIRLWEAERGRMEISDAVALLSEFEGEAEYKGVLEELRKGDWVVYYNDSKRTIVTTEEGVDAVKAFRQAQAAVK